ncbi:restriction endonuclease subunit S [Nostoc sp. DSM 114167]|jgi:type I restriction enzyme S subunit|uniref:restriction endonuclease subunit S n=1 Tax=Nostoc sp. DSM 114167 TaxID=3439050 RepID=UPI004046151C
MTWIERRLDELGYVSRGRSRHRPRDHTSLYGGNYPFIQTGDVKHSQFYIRSYTQTYNEKGLAQSRLWSAGTLCITIAANIADTAILSFDACFPDSIIGFIANPHICDVRYIKYFFDTVQTRYKQIAQGAAQDNLSLQKLLTFPILTPPLATQQRIAEILSTYDLLIDNNNRRIALLEESIHQLYKEWFVHLHFPGYESVKVVDGIPEGWKLKKLEELGLLGRGKSKHRPRNDPSLYGGKFPFIQTGEVKEASLYITNYSQTYNERGLAQSKLWDAGTLLITIAANIAETAILTFSACFPDSLVGFIADSNQVSTEFIKYSIDTIKVRMRNVSTGAAQDNLSLEKIRIFDFLVPDKETMQLFTRITNPMFLQMKNLLVTNENLRQARDLILPRLMNGSIAV